MRRRFHRTFRSGISAICLAAVLLPTPGATAQIGPTSPCPNVEYQGVWQLEVANSGCVDLPITAVHAAIDALRGTREPGFEVEGFACVISRPEAIAGCRNRDGRGFTLQGSPTTRPTSPTTTIARAVPSASKAQLPAANTATTKHCGVVQGPAWFASSISLPASERTMWRVRAQGTRCAAATTRVPLVAAYINDPFTGRTFDVGPDRCFRAALNGAICAYNQASTPPWEVYDAWGKLKPVQRPLASIAAAGLYSVTATYAGEGFDTRPSILRVATSDYWVDAHGDGVTQLTPCHSSTNPLPGASWEYTAGQVLASGTTWRAFTNALCTDVRRLTPLVTESLSRSVPVYESNVEGWSCLAARGSDFAGAHLVTCQRRLPHQNAISWFSVYQDTSYNDTFFRFVERGGPFAALALAVSNNNLPFSNVQSCTPIDSPVRGWRRPASGSRDAISGTRWLVQTDRVPCGVVEVFADALAAEAIGSDRDPNRYRVPGITCQPHNRDRLHMICSFTNTALFGERPPRIAVGVFNESVYASLTG